MTRIKMKNESVKEALLLNITRGAPFLYARSPLQNVRFFMHSLFVSDKWYKQTKNMKNLIFLCAILTSGK